MFEISFGIKMHFVLERFLNDSDLLPWYYKIKTYIKTRKIFWWYERPIISDLENLR